MSDKIDTATPIDVLVIGAGPAGLSAATELKRLGVARVVVLDREADAGGIPRHCGHPPFGMREFKRVLTGPRYARKLLDVARNAGVEISTSTTVIATKPSGHLHISTLHGQLELSAQRVIYATGVRETPRSARLISGTRPIGVINTGALQSMVYLKNQRPFKHPVIIGSELVSFSAIQTCRHAGIKPQAMIEKNLRSTARWPSPLFAKFSRVPLYLNTRLLRIEGDARVNAVVVEQPSGEQRRIECDGVILSGQFTPESTLARSGHLQIDPATGGPRVDQFGRCSDPCYFATGNVLRAVETAGWSWNEGRQTARRIVKDLAGKLPDHAETILINIKSPLIKYSMPQHISPFPDECGMPQLQLRFTRRAKGTLLALRDGEILWHKKLGTHPERRVQIPITALLKQGKTGLIELKFELSD